MASKPKSIFAGDVLTVTARLARLSISPGLQKELPAIVTFIDELKAFGGKTAARPIAAGSLRGRLDSNQPAPWPLAAPTELVAQAPAHRASFIEVKAIFHD